MQESPCIHCEDSRFESTKDSSADGIDSSCRIRSCLPRIPGQSLVFISLADMYAQVLIVLTDSVLSFGCTQWQGS